jgi:hypothetical protein
MEKKELEKKAIIISHYKHIIEKQTMWVAGFPHFCIENV